MTVPYRGWIAKTMQQVWGQRKTYIRELEELDINVMDLVFGITLSVENSADLHYYGSIRRVGRALSEARDKKKVEDSLLQMICDAELDDYNRIRYYFLFQNYSYFSKDENLKKKQEKKLEEAVETLPGYLRQKLTGKK